MANEASIPPPNAEGGPAPSPPEGRISAERLRQIKRILAGEEPGEPAPVPQEVHAVVEKLLSDLDREVTPEERERLTQDATVLYYGGGQPVACMRTARGVMIFGIGWPAISQLVVRIPPSARQEMRIEHPTPRG